MQGKACCVTGHRDVSSDKIQYVTKALKLEVELELYVAAKVYQPSVYAKRNRYMVSRSDRVIAVYDGRKRGGTVGTIHLACLMKKELHTISY